LNVGAVFHLKSNDSFQQLSFLSSSLSTIIFLGKKKVKMHSKFLEGDLVKDTKTRSLHVINRIEKKPEGYICYVINPADDPFSNPSEAPYNQNSLHLAPKTCYKDVKTLASLFDKDEVDFINDLTHGDISFICLTKKVAEGFFMFLSSFIFELELMKNEKADDAVLAFLIRIIDKLGKFVNMPSNSKAEYYLHLVKKMMVKKDYQARWEDIKDLFIKAGESGDHTAYIRLGIFYLYGSPYNAPDITQAYNWFLKAEEEGEPLALAGLGVVRLSPSSPYIDLSKALANFNVAGMLGLAFGLYASAQMIYKGQAAGLSPTYAFYLVSQAFKKDLCSFLDGSSAIYLPEEGLLLYKLLSQGCGVKANKFLAAKYLLIGLNAYHKRKLPPLLVIPGEDNEKTGRELQEAFAGLEPEVLKVFNFDNSSSASPDFDKLFVLSTSRYYIDLIAEDRSTQYVKLTMTFSEDALPLIDQEGKITICDRVILRLKGASKIKELSSRFYLGLEYQASADEESGKLTFFFADDDNCGTFQVTADSQETTLQEWKGPINNLSFNSYYDAEGADVSALALDSSPVFSSGSGAGEK
jgi:TPR repeat protein